VLEGSCCCKEVSRDSVENWDSVDNCEKRTPERLDEMEEVEEDEVVVVEEEEEEEISFFLTPIWDGED